MSTPADAPSRSQMGSHANPRSAKARKTHAANRIGKLRKAMTVSPAEEVSPALLDDGIGDDDGWGPVRRGRQACRPCKGEGIDRRPGPGAGICCLNCEGEGSRKAASP